MRTTRDGKVVVVHDATLSRLWRHPAAVADLDLHEVRSLGLADQRVPTLVEVLDLASRTGTAVLIDATSATDALNAHATLMQPCSTATRGDLSTTNCWVWYGRSR